MDAIHTNTNNETTTISLSLKETLANAAKTWTKPTKKKPGRTSKFQEHIGTIRYLRSNRHMSYEDIALFFNQNGLKCSYFGLLNFAKSQGIGGLSKTKKKVKA